MLQVEPRKRPADALAWPLDRPVALGKRLRHLKVHYVRRWQFEREGARRTPLLQRQRGPADGTRQFGRRAQLPQLVLAAVHPELPPALGLKPHAIGQLRRIAPPVNK